MKKALTLLFLLLSTPAFAQTYTVEKVIDCRMLQLSDGQEVSLIGIQCPEVDMGKEATEFLDDFINRMPTREVLLEFDAQERDKYGRLLAYVFVDTGFRKQGPLDIELAENWYADYFGERFCIFINATMMKAGYASPMTIPPNVKYAELFKQLYEEARAQKRGLWSEPADFELPDYDALARECNGSGCCLASVKRMKEGRYLLAPGKTLAESGCPEGTKPDMLKCIDSYRWCVPE